MAAGQHQGLQSALYGPTILLIGRFMPGGLLARRLGAPRSGPAAWAASTTSTPRRIGRPRRRPARNRQSLPLARLAVRRHRPLIELQQRAHAVRRQRRRQRRQPEVMQGEIVGLIGPNGSGKTTLFNCISSVFTPTAGQILFARQDLGSLRRDGIARLGVGRTYQIPRPFGDLTVQENIAIPLMFDEQPLSPRDAMREARAFIDYAELRTGCATRADALSLQEKKALEFARALACRPRLLLVDEVASGLTPAEVNRFVAHIRARARPLRHHRHLGRAHLLGAGAGGRPRDRAGAGLADRRRPARRRW